MNEIGVVITLPPGREDNLRLSMQYLSQMSLTPLSIVIVCDGPGVDLASDEFPVSGVDIIATARRHEPGMEQPRNVGVRFIRSHYPDVTHAWFLDSDILIDPGALAAYYAAIALVGDKSILIGPYEWMMDGMRECHPELRTDFRWAMFDERGLGPHVEHLGVALGCFGGNLVWPIGEFIRVGGFHPQLHHGRCEDGELGLRAASHRIPMALVPDARGYHVAHAVDHETAVARNVRDVPLINEWHPWVQVKCAACDAVWEGGRDTCHACGANETKGGLIVTDQDGARFDYRCVCGAQVNTLEMWAHQGVCPTGVPREGQSWMDVYEESRQGDLILPEGMQ